MNFEEFIKNLQENQLTFEEACTEIGANMVECIDNMVYDDQDLYDFLDSLGATIICYDGMYAIIKTTNGIFYKVLYEDEENRFDEDLPDETILFFDKIFAITEA